MNILEFSVFSKYSNFPSSATSLFFVLLVLSQEVENNFFYFISLNIWLDLCGFYWSPVSIIALLDSGTRD